MIQQQPPQRPSHQACEGYDITIGSTCKDRCGNDKDDPYPQKAKDICQKFVDLYDGSSAVNCVANCLTDAEKKAQNMPQCDNRNDYRLHMHVYCYAKCKFAPTRGLPQGADEVGWNMLLPSAVNEAARSAGGYVYRSEGIPGGPWGAGPRY